jgi:hypothetical protein
MRVKLGRRGILAGCDFTGLSLKLPARQFGWGHGAGAHAPDEYWLIESANPKVSGHWRTPQLAERILRDLQVTFDAPQPFGRGGVADFTSSGIQPPPASASGTLGACRRSPEESAARPRSSSAIGVKIAPAMRAAFSIVCAPGSAPHRSSWTSLTSKPVRTSWRS